MSQVNNNTKRRKGKHLNYEERIKIETLSRLGIKSEKNSRANRMLRQNSAKRVGKRRNRTVKFRFNQKNRV